MNEQEINSPQTENSTMTPASTSSNGFGQNLSPKVATIIGVVILLLIAGGVWYWQKNRPMPSNTENYGFTPEDNLPFPEAQVPNLEEGSYFSPPELEPGQPTQPPTVNTTVTWKNPTKLSDQKLVKHTQAGQELDETLYYYMGDHGANKIIGVQAPVYDLGGPAMFFFEQTATGYVFMNLMSYQDIYRSATLTGSFALSPTITSADSKTYYRGLVGPNEFSWSDINFQLPYKAPGNFFVAGKDNKKVASIKEGTLYRSQIEAGDASLSSEKFFLRKYLLQLPNGLGHTYFIKYDFFSDDSIPNITWTDGTKNADGYRIDGGGGCGFPGGYAVPQRDVTNAIKITGKTSTGAAIYEFKDVNDKIVKYFYDLQQGKFYNPTTQQVEDISIQNWYNQHAVALYKNGVGDYVILLNTHYGSQAECGKPVVYLYPTQPTVVSVKVGADVTVSNPSYGKGWRVLAQPSGQLLNTDGKTYDSLFWEGLGHGDYPQITEGTIVARDQVERTVTDQLKQLGLNAKEFQDFKDFWMSRMPNTPYTRLTWFTTSQMDRLAPLYVSPKPDTVIRVFLDFQGLQSDALSLPAQRLSAIPRNGFTLIEWGGLLRK